MKNLLKNNKNQKTLYVLVGLIICVFLLIIARVTYSFLQPHIIEDKKKIDIKTYKTDIFKFELGNPLNLTVTSTTLPENGENKSVSTTAKAMLKANNTTNNATYNYALSINLVNNFVYSDGKTPEVILTIKDSAGNIITDPINGLTYGEFNGVSGYDITTKTGEFVLFNKEITSNSSETFAEVIWNITLTYLNLPGVDQSPNIGHVMTPELKINKAESVPLASYITPFYKTGGDADLTNRQVM